MIDARARVVDGKLRGMTLERLCAALEWRVFRLRRWIAQRKWNDRTAAIEGILSDPSPSRSYDSEEFFARLQNDYLPHPEYGYDPYSNWRRALERAQSILDIPVMQSRGKRVLELGAGDGMTARLLSDYGHDVTLCDLEDWRDARARSLPFLEGDICRGIPLGDDSFDLIYSYNTFEHLSDPAAAFREIGRLCRRNGLVLLSFNPLYCSPWGLHAFGTLNMPYAQFLFSRSFIDEKIGELGTYDLGRRAHSLQPLNEWRISQFRNLWQGDSYRVHEERVEENWSHLNIARQYPGAFRGRSLTVRDLVAEGVHVLLRKVAKNTGGSSGRSTTG